MKLKKFENNIIEKMNDTKLFDGFFETFNDIPDAKEDDLSLIGRDISYKLNTWVSYVKSSGKWSKILLNDVERAYTACTWLNDVNVSCSEKLPIFHAVLRNYQNLIEFVKQNINLTIRDVNSAFVASLLSNNLKLAKYFDKKYKIIYKVDWLSQVAVQSDEKSFQYILQKFDDKKDIEIFPVLLNALYAENLKVCDVILNSKFYSAVEMVSNTFNINIHEEDEFYDGSEMIIVEKLPFVSAKYVIDKYNLLSEDKIEFSVWYLVKCELKLIEYLYTKYNVLHANISDDNLYNLMKSYFGESTPMLSLGCCMWLLKYKRSFEFVIKNILNSKFEDINLDIFAIASKRLSLRDANELAESAISLRRFDFMRILAENAPKLNIIGCILNCLYDNNHILSFEEIKDILRLFVDKNIKLEHDYCDEDYKLLIKCFEYNVLKYLSFTICLNMVRILELCIKDENFKLVDLIISDDGIYLDLNRLQKIFNYCNCNLYFDYEIGEMTKCKCHLLIVSVHKRLSRSNKFDSYKLLARLNHVAKRYISQDKINYIKSLI
jgi:hypothetical protein